MKKLVLGITLFLVIALVIGVGVFKLGLLPVNADVPPSGLETRFIPIVVHASVASHAEEQPNPVAPTDENLIAGGEVYTELCARCHGTPGRGPSVLGASFYPPAPQFTVQPSEYSEGQLFWIVKHGIRNTGMPAWGRLLTDQDIWQVVTVLRRLNSLPPAAAGRHVCAGTVVLCVRHGRLAADPSWVKILLPGLKSLQHRTTTTS